MNLNPLIDHTLLKPTASKQEIIQLCDDALEHNFASVCIPPNFVFECVQKLEDTKISVGTVVGFPFGFDDLSTKIYATQRALDQGANEIDAVLTINAIKRGDWSFVENEIETISTIVNKRSDKILKLIFETAYLDFDEIRELCNLCKNYDVDFVKTSTGYADLGATEKVVLFMSDILEKKVAVKASGGIKTRAFAEKLVKAGATRLGTSSGLNIIK